MPYQKCPKCDGQGIVSKPPWVAGDVTTWVSSSAAYPCSACNGSGLLFYKDILNESETKP